MTPKRRRTIKISVIITILAIVLTAGFFVLKYGYALLQIKSAGVALKPTKAIELRAVVYYLQNDPAWSSDKLGNTSSSMGGAGCLVTSISTAMDYYGVKYSPQEVNRLFSEKGVFNDSGQVIWKDIKNAVPEIDYKYDRVFDTRTIETLLDEGLLPIIEVKYRGAGASHWVVVIGSDGADFLVMDPLNQSKTPVKLSEHGGRAYAYRVLVK
jgi:hypothetical protein